VWPAKELVDDEYGGAASTARLRRIDLRVVIGLALLLAGVLGTVAVVQRAGQRVPVLVVARDVPAGQVVGDQDVRVAELALAPGVATLGVGDRGRVVGRVASVPLAAGQVLPPAAMVDGGPALGPGRVAMSVAVAPAHAAAGLLRAGDRVAVVASGTVDQPDVRAGVVLSSVPVLSVMAPPADGGGEGRLLVSVAVTLEEAPLLARAAQATIDLVLLPRAGDG
jgi:Flp pilus assembly protein CpaB